MRLYITPEMARAAYDLLRTTPPFRGWHLPPAEQIHFIVRAKHGEFGMFRPSYNGKPHKLYLSQDSIGQLSTLIATLAHEMVHIKEFIDCANDWGDHKSENFNRLADRVCHHHGFDRRSF